MLHIHCDRCDRVLVDDEPHHVVRIEISTSGLVDGLGKNCPTSQAPVKSDDEGIDHLSELSDQLDAGEPIDRTAESDTSHTTRQYDLCESCYRQFASDPMGRTTSKAIQFSMN